MSTIIWILLAALYLVCLISLGMMTFRKGHFLLFVIGFFFPILWVVGALIGPTPRGAGAA